MAEDTLKTRRRLAGTARRGWPMALAIYVSCWPARVEAQTTSEELLTATRVRSMTSEEAQLHHRVRLRGVVTFFEESLFSRFIQDETSGVYLFDSSLPVHLLPGQLVEVEGTTSSGEFAPIVVPEQIRVIGQAPLPTPSLVTYEQIASGIEDSQFVEIVGTVRSVQYQDSTQYYILEIATGGGRLSVYVRKLPVERMGDLPDSTVRIRGVCSTQFNHRRQLFAIRLMVPRAEDLVVETPAPSDPFATSIRPIGSLLQFTPRQSFGRRVKVKGTVIYHGPGKVLFLQDQDQGVEVQTKSQEALVAGDQVEALGFVSQGDYTPVLQDAIYRRISAGQPISPKLVTPDDALRGEHDCQLIQITAKLLDRALHGSERYLILQESNSIFQAYFNEVEGGDPVANLENGSRITVTGVCRVEPGEWLAGENWRAKSFHLQMRSAADVRLLEAPSWWTRQRVLGIAVAVGALALTAFAWVGVLRRQVTQRGHELEIQIQERQRAERRREIEQERARVAHDLHDDLGARLTEVTMLSSLVKSSTTSPDEKKRYLDELSKTARGMVTSLDEIVWAVNPRNDTIASLASYFGSYAQRLLELAAISCGLDVAEELQDHPLDPRFRQELFLAFKEALTNVVRHAQATQVWIRISIQNQRLVVVVADNGQGLDSRTRAAGADGMANMKDRLQSLGGECAISSEPQNGTTVRLEAPLPQTLL